MNEEQIYTKPIIFSLGFPANMIGDLNKIVFLQSGYLTSSFFA